MYRDFSDKSKENLLKLVSDVEEENWCGVTDWFGDRWLDFQGLIGHLKINKCLNDIDRYYKKLVDKNNTTKNAIEEIFCKVASIDRAYDEIFDNLSFLLSQWNVYIEQLSDITNPCNGSFNTIYMDERLKNLLSCIDKQNIECLRDKTVQNVEGELVSKDSAFIKELKENYGIDDLLAGSGYIGKIYGYVNDIKSAEGWYDYVDTGVNVFSFLFNAKRTWKNYKLIGNAVGVKKSTAWWFKNVTGVKPLGRSSTASTWLKRFGNNLTNKTSPFASQIKSIGKDFTGANGVGKAVSSWSTIALTGVVNFFGNKQEQMESNGAMTDERVIAETVTETAIDTAISVGASVVVGAAVAACSTVALPGVVVTAAAGLVVAGVNAGIKVCTGKTATEWISDAILDTGEKVVNAVGDAAKNVKNAVSGWFKKLKFA